jgi:type IV secretion system protein TrbJ
MSKRKSMLQAVAIAIALSSPVSAMAWGKASEYTQILNKLQLVKVASHAAKSARAEVSALAVQNKQYGIDVANNARFGSMPSNTPHSDKSQADLAAYVKALDSLHGSLEEQEKMMEARMTEARLSGLTWEQYTERVHADAQNQNKRAISRMQYEASVLEQVKSDYDAARSFEPMIENSVGTQQSLQVMNKQMNRLVLQNAKLTETLVATMQESTRAQAAGAATKERSAAEMTTLNSQQMAITARQKAAAKALQAK